MAPAPTISEHRHALRPSRSAALVVVVALLGLLAACSPSTTDAADSVPSTVPDVALVDLQTGADADLADYRGTPLVVNLWATWCTPCRAEMPVLQATQDRLGDQVQIVGITDDANHEASLEAAETMQITYPLLVDTEERFQSDLGVTGLPATAFLDTEGRLVELHAGVLDEEALAATIGRLHDDA